MSEAYKHVFRELEVTPGLGRRAEGRVRIKTPLKRKARVETGVCRGNVPLRTPKNVQTPKKKRTR